MILVCVLFWSYDQTDFSIAWRPPLMSAHCITFKFFILILIPKRCRHQNESPMSLFCKLLSNHRFFTCVLRPFGMFVLGPGVVNINCDRWCYVNPFSLEFTIVIFIHYKPRIAVAILALQWMTMTKWVTNGKNILLFLQTVSWKFSF